MRTEYKELICSNHKEYIRRVLESKIYKPYFACHPDLKKQMRRILASHGRNLDQEIEAGARCVNQFHASSYFRMLTYLSCLRQDILIRKKNGGPAVTDYSDASQQDYLSLAVIAKNEARNLDEFIRFYQCIGVDRIYFYDNGSTDNTREVLRNYMETGYLVYIRYSGSNVQSSAYRHAVRYAGKRTRWLAFIDCDEFLFSPHKDIKQELKRYEAYPAVGVNWVMFGPSGHVERPDGLVIKNYDETIADYDDEYNCRIKSIVQPGEVICITNPHFAWYRNHRRAVDEDMQEIDDTVAFKPGFGRAFTAVNKRKTFRINHYSTKSLEDLREKCKRGYPDGHANAVFEEQLAIYDKPLCRDREILDIARRLEGR